MNGKQIRATFLQYFAERGHEVVPSSSLVPAGDPTLLFTNAGMVQFKRVFLGEEGRGTTRAATSQKCVRAGGKHNDLENVGRTARHHTFFEMLGNFSFGDYFKREAIGYAWELLTQVCGLDRSRLYATVHTSDDEAAGIWEREVGLPVARIHRLGDKDNFWAMGDTGPCGPCSEILIDQGEALGCGKPTCGPGCDCDRYLEIWNLVFMQYNRAADGTLAPLPRPSIDTGMGLERIAAVMQGVHSNFDSDLLSPLVNGAAELAGRGYRESPQADVSMRVIADHVRAVTFLVSDGVLPSNEGRGYVLRRILRRAVRHGKLLGLNDPFLHRLTARVADLMGDAYPSVVKNRPMIDRVVKAEEERFFETLDRGLRVVDEAIAEQRRRGGTRLEGETVFKLYDTYGFPDDLTRDLAAERGLSIDDAGFHAALEAQRERGRRSWKGRVDLGSGDSDLEATRFVGYDALEHESEIAWLRRGTEAVGEAREGDDIELVVPVTPFYAESGGQIGDRGVVAGGNGRVEILETQPGPGGVVLHRGRVIEGAVAVGDVVRLEVDREARGRTRLNHSATHLLHAALRSVLGDHIKQAGSLVTPERLRFDFSHYQPIEQRELALIERLVNEEIRANLEVTTELCDREQALKSGAMAFFEEKYGERVRVVRMGDFSLELCGGTHVRRTGDIGLLQLVHESGVAAGTRRIEARTGEGALDHVALLERRLEEAAGALRVPSDALAERIEKLVSERRQLERELERLRDQLRNERMKAGGAEPQDVAGIPLLAVREAEGDPASLRVASDRYVERFPNAVVVLGGPAGDRASILVRVPEALTKRLAAGKVVGKLAEIVGGKGGGKPAIAQGGGPGLADLDRALASAPVIVADLLGA